VVFIPRKPHPNGLLVYCNVTFVNHPIKKGHVLPWILDMYPHIKTGDVAPIHAVEMFMKR
jgi:hypothetical protein